MRNTSIYKELGILFFLSILLILRLFWENADYSVIQYVGYCGVMVSLTDLFFDAQYILGKNDKFQIIRGAFIICIMIWSFSLLLFAIKIIPIRSHSKLSDTFTLLALIISLPNRLYLNWIKRYIEKG